MNFDQPPKQEQIGKNREKLLELEKQGCYVFHGSPVFVDALEPRQAYNYNQQTNIEEEDGTPAVFATPNADAAIFMALMTKKGVEGDSSSGFSSDDDGLHFFASQNLFEIAKLRVGRVYVLDKSKFIQFEGAQCRSDERVIPKEVIDVTFEDLPPGIKIIAAETL